MELSLKVLCGEIGLPDHKKNKKKERERLDRRSFSWEFGAQLKGKK